MIKKEGESAPRLSQVERERIQRNWEMDRLSLPRAVPKSEPKKRGRKPKEETED